MSITGWAVPLVPQHVRDVISWRFFFQEAVERTDVSKGLTQVDDLRPLTAYEFQMRTCYSGLTRNDTGPVRSAASERLICSKWSPSVRRRSPGKGELAIHTKHDTRQADCDDVRVCCHSYTTHNLWLVLSSGPSQQLHVWRILGSQKTNGSRMVTVLWKVMFQSSSFALTFTFDTANTRIYTTFVS